MGRGKSKLEKCNESKERAACRNSEESDDRCIGAVDRGKRGSGVASTRRNSAPRKQGKADDDNAEEVLLQHQSTDAGGPGASQAIGRKADGGAESSRRDGERIRISVQPAKRHGRGISGLGGDGKQVLP